MAKKNKYVNKYTYRSELTTDNDPAVTITGYSAKGSLLKSAAALALFPGDIPITTLLHVPNADIAKLKYPIIWYDEITSETGQSKAVVAYHTTKTETVFQLL